MLFAGLIACTSQPRGHVERGPNVLLITLDTLRRDHLSSYGYDKPTSPFLDSLAKEGTRFTSAYAASNLTKPSHTSILTGLHPKNHGIMSNNAKVLHDDVLTLAEIFHERGYATFAVTSASPLGGSYSGLDQGFEVYYNRKHGFRRKADRVVREARDLFKRWRREPKRRPFFAWLHFYDCHTRYSPPAELLEEVWTPARPGESRVQLPVSPHRGTELVNGGIPVPAMINGLLDPSYYRAAYDALITHVDSQLEELFTTLNGWRIGETIVAITADHGEMLGEYGIYYNHASIYEPVAAVPLILLAPGRPMPPTVDAVVENLDIAPTLLDLLGWAPPVPFDGHSLVPLLEGRERSGEFAGYAFTQTARDLQISVRDASGALIASAVPSENTRRKRYRNFDRDSFLGYIRARPLAFYPRSQDSAETAPVEPEGEARNLIEVLRRWRGRQLSVPQSEQRPLTSEESERLQALGYL